MVKFQDLEEVADDGFETGTNMNDNAMKQYRNDFDCEQREYISTQTLKGVLTVD